MKCCFERRKHPSSATTFLAMPPFRSLAEQSSRCCIQTASTASLYLCTNTKREKANSNNNRYTAKPAAAATHRKRSQSVKTKHSMCCAVLCCAVWLCVQQQICTTFGDTLFSFETILAFWMRDWLDYKYTYIDDGRSIRLYYPTRSKHSKAKWCGLVFFYYVFRCEQFYVHNFILFFFIDFFFSFFDHCFCFALTTHIDVLALPFCFLQLIFLQFEINQKYTTLALLFIYDFDVDMLECHPNCKTEYVCVCFFCWFCSFSLSKNLMQVFSWFFMFPPIFGCLALAHPIRKYPTKTISHALAKANFAFIFWLDNNAVVWIRSCKDTTFRKKRDFFYSWHDHFTIRIQHTYTHTHNKYTQIDHFELQHFILLPFNLTLCWSGVLLFIYLLFFRSLSLSCCT